MPADLQRIETVVIVMLENRSFDHVLGYLSRESGRTDINGLGDDAWIAAHANEGPGGRWEPRRVTRVDIPDPPHEREDMALQIGSAAGSPGPMRGFVQSYARRDPPPEDESLVMGYYLGSDVPIADFFAHEFTICDRWFASLPTSTQPNRLMAMSGESRLEHTHGRPLPSQQLVYDWLDDLPTPVPWRVYYDGPFPFFTLMPDWAPEIGGDIVLDGVGLPGRFRRYERFAEDWFWDPDLPPVVFIEPEFTDAPHRDADDDHPPTSIGAGQKFLHSIYTALISRPDRWAKTLLIVTYDEHGGFFDHEPPLAGRTDPPPGDKYPPFETTGVRVPAFLISPFVERGGVFSKALDHTCILSFLAERFAAGQPYTAAVAERTARLKLSALSLALTAEPRNDVPIPPPVAGLTVPTLPTLAVRTSSENALAFSAAARNLLTAEPLTALHLFSDAGHIIDWQGDTSRRIAAVETQAP